jgi:hypothetical protein
MRIVFSRETAVKTDLTCTRNGEARHCCASEFLASTASHATVRPFIACCSASICLRSGRVASGTDAASSWLRDSASLHLHIPTPIQILQWKCAGFVGSLPRRRETPSHENAHYANLSLRSSLSNSAVTTLLSAYRMRISSRSCLQRSSLYCACAATAEWRSGC